jgi:hypothetical protein
MNDIEQKQLNESINTINKIGNKKYATSIKTNTESNIKGSIIGGAIGLCIGLALRSNLVISSLIGLIGGRIIFKTK